MESFWYECSPLVYFVSGLLAILTLHSPLGDVSGVALIALSAMVLTLRHVHRQKPARRTSSRQRSATPG